MAKPKGKRGNKYLLSLMNKERFIDDPLSYTSYERVSFALRSDGCILTKRIVIFKQIHKDEPLEGIRYEHKWKKSIKAPFNGSFFSEAIDIPTFEEKFSKLGFSKVTRK